MGSLLIRIRTILYEKGSPLPGTWPFLGCNIGRFCSNQVSNPTYTKKSAGYLDTNNMYTFSSTYKNGGSSRAQHIRREIGKPICSTHLVKQISDHHISEKNFSHSVRSAHRNQLVKRMLDHRMEVNEHPLLPDRQTCAWTPRDGLGWLISPSCQPFWLIKCKYFFL